MVEISLIFNKRSRLILRRFHATAGFTPLSLLSHTAQDKQREMGRHSWFHASLTQLKRSRGMGCFETITARPSHSKLHLSLTPPLHSNWFLSRERLNENLHHVQNLEKYCAIRSSRSLFATEPRLAFTFLGTSPLFCNRLLWFFFFLFFLSSICWLLEQTHLGQQRKENNNKI